MMELLEDVFIRCSRCGKVTGIHKEDFDFESYVYDRGDNRMGEEIEFRHEGYIKCDQCDNEISFRISGYEYPIGAFNYEDSEITGGRFEEEPHMGVIYSQDDFDLDDAYCSSWQSKYMTTKWGTCNTNTQKIWLNLQLAKKPIESLEYVILHELAHLKVKNHGPEFVAVLDQYMPQWQERKRLLNESKLDYMDSDFKKDLNNKSGPIIESKSAF